MLGSPVARGAVVAGAMAIAACGSSSTGSLFSNGAASGGAAGASISSGGSISVGGLPAASGGASGSSAGGGGGAQVDGGGTVQGGGVPGSGGLGTAGGSGGVQSAGGFGFGGVAAGGVGGHAGTGATSNGGRGGVPSGEVACERASCSTAANEHCCFGDTIAAHCFGGSSGGQCSCGIFCTTIDVECDGPEDCSEGKHCCGEMGLTDYVYTHLYCQTNCDSSVTTTLTEICHLGSNICSNGNPCSNDGLVPTGYGDCG